MSFDLAFWWEKRAISPDEAARKYGALVEGGVGIVDEHPALVAFYSELTDRFPDLTEENSETSPWAASLYRTGECVITSISYPRQEEVSEYLLGLARRYGVASYDPQSGKVYYPGGDNPGTLELASGSVIMGPSQSDVSDALRALSSEDWYVILETRPGWFIQVGYGSAAGAPTESYALEVREGLQDRHFRAISDDLEKVIDAFAGFMHGDSSWREKFDFYRVTY